MLKLTLFDKFKILFELMLASPFFIFLFIFTLLALCVLLDLKDTDKKKARLSILGIYLLVFIVLIIKYHSSLLSVLDYFVNNVFIIFYFPNLAIYTFMILIINVIMIKSLFLKKNEPIRVINLTLYSVIMYLMLLIIYTVSKENINVYDQASLYTNGNILALVELSNIIFVVWLIILLLDKILFLLENKGVLRTRRTITKVVEKEVVKEVQVPVYEQIEVPVEKEVIKKVPVEVIKEVQVPVEKEVIKEVPVEKEVIKEVPVEVVKEVIKEVPIEVEKEVIKEVEVPVEKEVIKEVPVVKEVIKEVPVEVEKIVYRDSEKNEPIVKEVPVVREVIKEVPIEKEIVKEVKVEVPVEKEVIKEVPIPMEIVKEVQVPVEKEVIKEVQVPVEKEVIKEVPVEVIKEVPVEKIIYKEKEDDIFSKEDYQVMLKILKSIRKDYN